MERRDKMKETEELKKIISLLKEMFRQLGIPVYSILDPKLEERIKGGG